MTLLVDVDALAKLAHWRILGELPRFTSIPLLQCVTLTSAKYRAQRSVEKPDARVFHSTEAATEALRAIASMGRPLATDVDQLPALQGISGIDAGEAVLLSALTKGDVRLLTGDKRAVRALAGLDVAQRTPFVGKIFVVEQVLLAGLNQNSIDWLRERVCAYKDIDKAIGNVMGSKCEASEQSVREGLESYIRELQRVATPSLIAPL